MRRRRRSDRRVQGDVAYTMPHHSRCLTQPAQEKVQRQCRVMPLSLRPKCMDRKIPSPAVSKEERTSFLFSLVIAAVAAYVDATGYLLYSGIYLSFMSGNSTRAAVLVARGDWQQLAPVVGVIPTFLLGVMLGTIVHGISKRQGQAIVFSVAGIALAVVAALEAYGHSVRSNDTRLGLFFTLAAAMGLLNSTVQRVGKVSVALTFVTGTLVKLGAAIGRQMTNRGRSDGGDQRATIVVLTSMYCAFFLGAVCGGLAAALYGLRCTIAPALILIGLGLLCWFLEAKNKTSSPEAC
jgi:uncharacterized membrane protein YoaK (UPF0700 family)